MNRIYNLTLLQMENNYSFLFNKKIQYKILFFIIYLISIVLITIFFIFVIPKIKIIMLIDDNNFLIFCSTFISLIGLIFIIIQTIVMTKRIYFESNNIILDLIPLNKYQIIFSKILLSFIEEIFRDFLFVFPLLLSLCITSNNLPIYKYLLILPTFVIFIFYVLGFSIIFVFPLMLIMNLIKKNIWVMIFSFISLMIITFLIYSWLMITFFSGFNPISGTNSSIEHINWTMKLISKIFYFTYTISSILFGIPNIIFLILTIIIPIVLIVISIPILRWGLIVFSKISYTKTKQYINIFDNKKIKLNAFIKKDIVLLFRKPNNIFNVYFFIVISPLFMFSLNIFLYLINLSSVGIDLIKSTNLMMYLLFVMVTCEYTSTSISNELNNLYLIKNNLNNFKKFLLSKIYLNVFITMFFVVGSLIVETSFSHLKIYDSIMIFLILLLSSFYQSIRSIEKDLIFVNKNYGKVILKNNYSFNLSLIFGIIFSLLIGFSVIILSSKINYLFLFLFLLIFIAILLAIKIYYFLINIKYFFWKMEV